MLMYLTASNYRRQKLRDLQGEIDESIIIVGDFNTPLEKWADSVGQIQVINKNTVNNTINQPDIIHIKRLLDPAMAENTFFSSSHGTFTKIDYILGHKTHLNTLKSIETMQCMLSDHMELN